MKVLGFGAVLWDKVLPGRIGRAGEACSRMTIGGSVFNVMGHMAKLGWDAYMVSAIGKDELGKRTEREFRRLSIHADYIKTAAYPTCCVSVVHDADGQPRYFLPGDTSWDHIVLTDEDLAGLKAHDFRFIVFGTIEQRNAESRSSLYRLFDALPSTKKYLDLTLRDNFHDESVLSRCLSQADIIKMNREEAETISGIFRLGGKKPEKILSRICKRFGCEIACITCGGEGAFIGDGMSVVFKPGYEVTTADTIGSGDAFSAGMLHALCSGETIGAACDFGNRLGALTAAKHGAIPDYSTDEALTLKTAGGKG